MNHADLSLARARALAMVSEGRPLTEILGFLVSQAENVYDDDSVCSALVLAGKTVITREFLCDSGRVERRQPPLDPGLRPAWSVPIVGEGGRVLGTFGTYSRETRAPRPEERRAVEGLAEIARLVIEAA